MRILVTNDDGIHAPGIAALVKELAKLGTVYVSAPDHNCSANSHHLTMTAPIPVRRMELAGAAAAWAVGGTPADCAQLALSALLDGPVDLIVSGINSGSNLATDCLYSGTVAAALEARIRSVAGIAVSLDSFDKAADFSVAARAAAQYAPFVAGYGKPITLNINVPALPQEEIKGVKLCAIDRFTRYPGDIYAAVPGDEPGQTVYRFIPAMPDPADPSADTAAVRDGYISITPLTCFWSDRAQLEELKKVLPQAAE